MRVVIDGAKCSGYGTCNGVSSAIFKLDDWGYAYVDADEATLDAHADDVRRAARECPTDAIIVQE
jgi:ferredoxin